MMSIAGISYCNYASISDISIFWDSTISCCFFSPFSYFSIIFIEPFYIHSQGKKLKFYVRYNEPSFNVYSSIFCFSPSKSLCSKNYIEGSIAFKGYNKNLIEDLSICTPDLGPKVIPIISKRGCFSIMNRRVDTNPSQDSWSKRVLKSKVRIFCYSSYFWPFFFFAGAAFFLFLLDYWFFLYSYALSYSYFFFWRYSSSFSRAYLLFYLSLRSNFNRIFFPSIGYS